MQLAFILLVSIAWAASSRDTPASPYHHGNEPQTLLKENLQGAEELQQRFALRTLSTDDRILDIWHGLLARGSDYELANAGSVSSWILQQATANPLTRPRPLLEHHLSGWRFAPARSVRDVGHFEAHQGQFLFYLTEIGWDAAEADIVRVATPTGDSEVSLRDLVVALQFDLNTASADVSYVLPVLIRWATRWEWTNRFGEKIRIDDIVNIHLDRERASVICGGLHWRQALAIVMRSIDRLPVARATRRKARDRFVLLKTEMFEAIGADGSITPLTEVEQQYAQASRTGHHAHALECLLEMIEGPNDVACGVVHSAAHRMIVLLRSDWDALSYRELCHAMRALRIYSSIFNTGDCAAPEVPNRAPSATVTAP